MTVVEYGTAVGAMDLTPLDAPASAMAGKPLFTVLSLDQVLAIPKPTFLIDDILPEHAIAEIHGPPKIGKTFVVLDLALSVASGRAFLGHPVRKGAVLYVIGEGKSGLGARVRAWLDTRGIGFGVRFHTLPSAVQLREARHMTELRRTIGGLPEAPVLVIYDTFSRCFVGGEENSATDVGEAFAALERLRDDTGAAQLVVHHTNKAGDVERGSSSFRASTDTMLSLKEENDRLLLTCEAQKETAEFAPIVVQLTPHLESLVVTIGKQPTGPGTRAMALLQILVTYFPSGAAAVTEWSKAAAFPDSTFYRCRGELLNFGMVAEVKGGSTKRFAATPEGRIALSRFTESENSQPNSQSQDDEQSASGSGGFLPRSGRTHPGARGSDSHSGARNSQAKPPQSENSQPNSQNTRTDAEQLDMKDLEAEIDERTGMREN